MSVKTGITRFLKNNDDLQLDHHRHIISRMDSTTFVNSEGIEIGERFKAVLMKQKLLFSRRAE